MTNQEELYVWRLRILELLSSWSVDIKANRYEPSVTEKLSTKKYSTYIYWVLLTSTKKILRNLKMFINFLNVFPVLFSVLCLVLSPKAIWTGP